MEIMSDNQFGCRINFENDEFFAFFPLLCNLIKLATFGADIMSTNLAGSANNHQTAASFCLLKTFCLF